MADKEFDDAKLIYDLLAKSGKGVSQDAINEIARMLDISISNEKLKERIERLGRGLPSEDEFIALAIWFGKCKLIHKLDQEQFPSISAQNYQVPDLYAVFEYKGCEIPVLIEVKSESAPKSSNPKLRLANKLYKKLNNYASVIKLPLLIAWRVNGDWLLFDIGCMKKVEAAFRITWEEARKADLMSVLLGNLNIIPIPRVKLVLQFKRLGDPGQHQSSKDDFMLVDGRFENIPQKHTSVITSVSRIQFTLWSLMELERKTIKGNNQIDVIYEVLETPTSFPFYALLPFVVFYLSPEQKRPTNWFQANKTQNYGIISFSELKRELESGIGILFQEIIQFKPSSLPDFMTKIE